MTFQDAAHPKDHDYVAGSPHLKHPVLRDSIVAQIQRAVKESPVRGRPLRILEVGAGHGTFTESLLKAGCAVTITEMSRGSASVLGDRFRGDAMVKVILDERGTYQPQAGSFDGVVAISVLHHIPDYLSSVDTWTKGVVEGGFFLSAQDPLLYERVRRSHRQAAMVSYYLWRTTQGGWRRGLQTVRRRLRKGLDETCAEDMSEYHVVRSGVDESALCDLLETRFKQVSVTAYWATQSTLMQRAGSGRLSSHFSIYAASRMK